MSERKGKGEIALIEKKSTLRRTVLDLLVLSACVALTYYGLAELGAVMVGSWFPNNIRERC